MTEKTIEIRESYKYELQEIQYKLAQLESGRLINKYNLDESLADTANQLRTMIDRLINKIEYQEPSALAFSEMFPLKRE